MPQTFADILKFNPYHDSRGRFASSDTAASFTYAPGKSTAHDAAIQRGREAGQEGAAKGFKGTLYHGSPETDIEEFDMARAGSNTSSGEKLIYFTDSKQMAEDFSYERLEGSTKYLQRRGKKGRVYEVDVEMKNPLDLRNLTDKDIENILQLDMEGLLTREMVQSLSGNHQLLKTSLNLSAESLKKLGYDGLIANTGKAGHNSLEYAVVDSKQAKIKKGAAMVAKTFDEVLKFNPYHDSRGRFASANSYASFTFRTKDPSKQHLADAAAAREREREAAGGADAPAEEKETPRMQSIHNVEDKIRDQFYESAAVIDGDGNVLFYKDGAQSSVGFNRQECDMMKDNTLTHNHPRSSMFSTEDAVCFVHNNMQEIRATTREGNTYSLKRGEGYTEDKGTYFIRDYNGEQIIARRLAQQDLDRRGFQGKIMDGEITHEQANREFGRVVTNYMIEWTSSHASKYGVEFNVEKRNVENDYTVEVFTSKSAGGDDDGEIVMTLDKETDAANDAAFNEWLDKNNIPKEETAEKSFSVFKTDDDKRLVFGWASVSITAEGEQLEDRQYDIIDPEDLEEAAYEYVLNFRDTGERHNPNLRKKGKLVESCVFTAEKQKAMGIPEGTVPVGWWIGFKITDDEAWEKVKSGVYKMFSIEGKANRVPVEKAAPAEEPAPDRFDHIEEFP